MKTIEKISIVVTGIFYLGLLMFSLFLWRYDSSLAIYLLASFLGNLTIGCIIWSLHTIFETERYRFWHDNALKNFTGFIETILYSSLLSFKLLTLLAGVLIVKSVGNIGDRKHNYGLVSPISEAQQDAHARSSRIVAIYRLGFALQLILIIFLAFILNHSRIFTSLVSADFFNKFTQ